MVIQQGKAYIGHQATEEEICKFISLCVKADNDVVYKDAVNDAILEESWEVNYTWKDKELAEYFKYDGYFQEFDLFYKDQNNTIIQVKEQDILKVYRVWMDAYDTEYLIYIFETKDNQLLLGCNNPE